MSPKKIFVIACYYDGSNNSIFECVKSIQKYYKSAKIVVIDSNSPDKTYFQKLKTITCKKCPHRKVDYNQRKILIQII